MHMDSKEWMLKPEIFNSEDNGAIKNIEEIQWIHQNNHSLNASTSEALKAQYTFVMLRNPFKRLLSFFLDKLVTIRKKTQ